MTLRDTIDYAQTHFGDNRGVPDVLDMRPRLPPWLEGRTEDAIRTGSIPDGVLPVSATDSLVLEGTPVYPVSNRDDREDVAVEEHLAYYLPFHFYRNGWGTYIRAAGLDRLARILAAPGRMSQFSLSFAYRLLLEHERFHYVAEVAAARLEVISGASVYRPYFQDRDAAILEEALANAQALTSAKRGTPKHLVQAAVFWMSNQGPGYRDLGKWLGRSAAGRREAASIMSRTLGRSAPPAQSKWPGEFLFEERRQSHPPTYLVVDQPVSWLRVARAFPKLHGLQIHVHTNDHKPPHIHIAVLGRGQETRYEWPVLRPLPGDLSLSRPDEKNLRKYVAAMETRIESKVNSVLWR